MGLIGVPMAITAVLMAGRGLLPRLSSQGAGMVAHLRTAVDLCGACVDTHLSDDRVWGISCADYGTTQRTAVLPWRTAICAPSPLLCLGRWGHSP
jgi:hypothetical protein